jgi:hypothetical protein
VQLISDQQLFTELDLATPGLGSVAEAIRDADMAAARSSFADHLRSRSYPIPAPLDEHEDQRGHGKAADDVAVEANRICDHLFEFVGHPPQQLGEQLAWNEDPVNYEQWAISFNRHFHWITLAKAYRATADEKYAEEFVVQLRSWIDAMPVEIGKRWIQAGWAPEGKMSLSLDAGIRMGQTWVPAFYAFLRSPSFSDDDCIAMVKAFRHHAEYLMDPIHFRSLSNWGVMEANGLYHIGAYFPEFTASSEWRQTAMDRLRGEIDLQMYPDGAQIELASGYHHVSLRNFVMAYRAALLNDLDVPSDYLASLERAYHYSLYVAFPHLRMPAVNDSGDHDIRSAMGEAARLFPSRRDFEYVATEGTSGEPLDPSSMAFPYAGHFVMRSGWARNAPAMFFDGGPFGYGHQHEDKLNIILYGHGQILIADPGNYQYDTSEWRSYMLSSWSHNTVVVDGEGQRQQGKPRETYIVDEPLPHTWISEPGFNYVSADYDEGYGPDADKTVTHRRSILYLKPNIWIITDILSPSDDQPHTYESAFIFNTDEATAESMCAHASTANGPGCAIYGLGSDDSTLRIAEGERDPLRGWMPKGGDISCCHPTPTAIYGFSGTGTVLQSYVVTPIAADTTSPVATVTSLPVSSTSAPAIAGRISLTDSRTIDFFQRVPGDHSQDAESDAEAGAILISASSVVESIHLVNGSRIRRNGAQVSVGDSV